MCLGYILQLQLIQQGAVTLKKDIQDIAASVDTLKLYPVYPILSATAPC